VNRLPDMGSESLMKTESERIVAEANKRGVQLRLMGAIAFQLHCAKYGFFSTTLERVLSDLDFAAYSKQRAQIDKMMKEFGYVERRETAVFFNRMIWDNKSNGLDVDIFLDRLDMNH
jgi:hypothetical protein